ncbi:TonB-dependent receptor domain-containing protein [Microscilla marina]|uniref:TonB-dependent receptor domain protein n=1 Tax=Microscilla marina ATCC 23134 TaxID=313606 RepID=A1ZQ13_MICM2|nr:TonB-dependent receptor [Microscilla marina]EAY27422.1 TonB-dependent receptor domain protein [Microscilla marina ATCC 23134]
MFRNLLLLFMGVLLMANQAIAQADVTGKIKDKDGEPVIAAVVALLTSPGDKMVKAAVAKNDGTFTIKMVKAGSYKLQIRVLGYKDYSSKAFTVSGNATKALDAITLENDIESLGEVVVKAEKPLVQVLADKTVFNVDNTVGTTGSSGFDLLRKAPGVIVDNNDNVMVEGKSGVLFYINGKPSVLRGEDLVNYLKTLQATDIEAIEIITQPSSKYDAEGNAGIINIKLKRDKSLGTNGTVSLGLIAGQYNRYTSSLSFNNRTKKTSLYGAYSNRIGRSFNFINFYRIQNGTTFDSRSRTVRDRNGHNLRLGFDYYLSKKSTLGAIVTGSFNEMFANNDSRTPIIPNGATTPSQVLVAESDAHNKTFNGYANVNYKYEGDKGRSLNIDVDYGQYISDRTNLQPNRFFDGDEAIIVSENITFFDTPVNIGVFSAQLNYTQNFLKGVLGIGGKYALVSTDNNFQFYDRVGGVDILNIAQTNEFFYDEQVTAAYFNYNRKFKKLNIQFGLRMEHTASDGRLESMQANADNQVKRDYVNWFPSGGLTYNLNRTNTLALNYSRRIRRPNYQVLNPFEYRIDGLSFRKGNPFLQPQYTDNVKLSHTYKYTLTTSLSYSFTSDYFAQVTEALPDNRNFLMTRNVANRRVINLGIAYPTRLTKWWSIYFSLNAYRSIFEATNPAFIGISQNAMSLYAQNTFKLPGGLTAEISGWYSSPSLWGGTYQVKSLGALNFAFQKKLLGNKITARLAFNDVLYTSPWRGDTFFPNLSIYGSGGWDSRQVRFSLSYNFGRKEIKRARKRKTSIENEKGRMGN